MSDSEFSPSFGSPHQALIDYCEAADTKFSVNEDLKGVVFSMRGEVALYDLGMFITHDEEVLEIFVTLPIHAECERLRPVIAEFVLRTNRSLGVGGFDLDMDDGQLCYHIGHVFGSSGLDEEAVGRLVATALQAVDRYFPALMLA
ncbi:MAG: YbjN domain-containing protein, partial [Chthoniobacterales bacterium]